MNTVIETTETLWKETNPHSTMSPPSMAYEIIEKHKKKYNLLDRRLQKQTSFLEYARLVTKVGDYTKEQALSLISWGYKMRHSTFSDNEWLEKCPKSNVHFLDENKNVINMKQFWRYRTATRWGKDWSLVNKKE